MAVADRKLEALSRVPLFSRCSPKELQFIAREGDEVDVPAGKTLIRQGKPGDTFYIQLEGQSQVEIDGRKRRVMKPGDFFYVPPGHDSWVVGDEPYVSLHILGSEGYAAPSDEAA